MVETPAAWLPYPGTAEHGPTAPSKFAGYAWAYVHDEHRNCDGLQDWCTPPSGCPECGAVWVEFDAVGFTSPRAEGGMFFPEHWLVQPYPTRATPIEAVRLICYSGHRVNFDGVAMEMVPPFNWLAAVGIGALALYGLAFAMKAAPP